MGFVDVLKKAYPFLTVAASLVPGGNVATSVLGKILNLAPSATLDDAGLALINATPEQKAQLLAEENRHAEALQQMGINSAEEFERIAAADRASARQREEVVKDWTPKILAYGVTLGFFGVLAMMFTHAIPDTGHDVLLVLIGSLGSAWIAIINYYYGSSSGSAAKTQILAAAAKK
jgi:hypothetical protein